MPRYPGDGRHTRTIPPAHGHNPAAAGDSSAALSSIIRHQVKQTRSRSCHMQIETYKTYYVQMLQTR